MITKTTLIAAALSIYLSSGAVADQPKVFGNAVTIGTVAGPKLTAEQRRAFKWYRSNKSYFGAFYIAPDTEHLFWTRNFHSLKVAKNAAKYGCELASEGVPCVLHAVVYPKGANPNDPGLVGLGQPSSKDFERKYPKRQKDGKYGAFAINGAVGYGFSFGWDSKREADQAALSYCDAFVARSVAPLGIEGRDWVKSNGLDKCRIVHTHTPD